MADRLKKACEESPLHAAFSDFLGYRFIVDFSSAPMFYDGVVQYRNKCTGEWETLSTDRYEKLGVLLIVMRKNGPAVSWFPIWTPIPDINDWKYILNDKNEFLKNTAGR